MKTVTYEGKQYQLDHDEIVVEFRATTCRPVPARDPRTGKQGVASEVFRQGSVHKLAKGHPCLADFIKAGACFDVTGPKPKDPYAAPPFINCPRNYSEADFKESDALVDRIIERIESKSIVRRLLDKFGLSAKGVSA